MIMWVLYVAALVCTFVSTSYLFYRQSIGDFNSDLKSHIRIALKEKSYSLQKYIFSFLHGITGDNILIVLCIEKIE